MRHFSGLSRMGVLVGVLAAGCGNGQDLVGSVFVKAVDVVASDGATIEVTAQESQELAGTRLVIPPGSLAQDTRITVALQREGIVLAPDYVAGPVAKWGPAGTVFEIAAELSMPFTLNAQQSELALFFQVVEENGERAEIFASDLLQDGALATMSVSGFTRYGAGVRGCPSGDPPPPQVDHSCPAGTVCYRGKCEPEPATTPEVCDDGLDNDEDGLVDCNDLLDCDQDPACVQPEICNDQIDNDGDGEVDCQDPDCAEDPACVGPYPEICYDQIDNDGDGLIDCADPDCADTTPCNYTCEVYIDCPSNCLDQRDNDGDGLVDCDDPGCQGSDICLQP